MLGLLVMAGEHPRSSDSERRILPFRRGSTGTGAAAPPPVQDLAKFEGGAENDDYRHRMLVNAAAFLFVVGLIGAGLWLADSMASLRRNQDCVFAGHRNCLPIETTRER
jgi:hypothetical protein